MQTGTGFWAAKVLLTAVEFDLFSTLGDRAMSAAELGTALGVHPRGRLDFFDALVALGFLHRDGDGAQGRYRNTPETAAFLVTQSPAYIGGMPEMLNSRLFGFWNSLGEALGLALAPCRGAASASPLPDVRSSAGQTNRRRVPDTTRMRSPRPAASIAFCA
jgi:hypothetical protein